MTSKITSTHELVGTKVIGGRKDSQRIGKVHVCVFHPTEKRCIGFLVKRPDLLLMFHRSDSFVALDSFTRDEDGRIHVLDNDGATGKAACKRLGIDWDSCVLWVGLDICTADGTKLARVGNVRFDEQTGDVVSVVADEGSANGILVGRKEIPASMVLGFKRGLGCRLSDYRVGEDDEPVDIESLGALLVCDEAAELEESGGIAAKAGALSAVAEHKVKQATAAAKPKVSEAAEAAGKAVDKGAYLAGKQLGRAKGMFGAFRDEYKKARR